MLFNFKVLAAVGLMLQSVTGAAVDKSLIDPRANGYKNMAYYGSWYDNFTQCCDMLLTNMTTGPCTVMVATASSRKTSTPKT
jgi:hypothetical protein